VTELTEETDPHRGSVAPESLTEEDKGQQAPDLWAGVTTGRKATHTSGIRSLAVCACGFLPVMPREARPAGPRSSLS
jgi:hypothetical protein